MTWTLSPGTKRRSCRPIAPQPAKLDLNRAFDFPRLFTPSAMSARKICDRYARALADFARSDPDLIRIRPRSRSAREDVLDDEPDVRGALGETAHVPREPVLAVGDQHAQRL